MILDGEDVAVPLYYVVSRNVPISEADSVLHMLRITPAELAIFSDPLDGELAQCLSNSICFSPIDKAEGFAANLATRAQRPVLLLGVAEFIDAVYSDGHREALLKHA